jgi:hypothetical protein
VKRLFLFLLACVTGWWGYRKLRSHPRTAGSVAEFERQSQLVVDRASDGVRSAKDQTIAKAADLADTAAAGAQDAIDTATGKAQRSAKRGCTKDSTGHQPRPREDRRFAWRRVCERSDRAWDRAARRLNPFLAVRSKSYDYSRGATNDGGSRSSPDHCRAIRGRPELEETLKRT